MERCLQNASSFLQMTSRSRSTARTRRHCAICEFRRWILALSLQTETTTTGSGQAHNRDVESARSDRKKVCMLAYTAYESDGRVRRYAEALANRGDHVDVIALSSGTIPLGVEKLNGVTLYRVQHRKHDERHKWTYMWRLLRFLFVAS